MDQRRSVKQFSDRYIPESVIINLIKTANTSPSAGHTQPWMFVCVKDAQLKKQIRHLLEEDDYTYFQKNRSNETIPWDKEYLEKAPYLIVMFLQEYSFSYDGIQRRHPFSYMGASIAAGLLITAIQNAGLCTLTSAPIHSDFSELQHKSDREHENGHENGRELPDRNGHEVFNYIDDLLPHTSHGKNNFAKPNTKVKTQPSVRENKCGEQLRKLLGRPINEKVLLIFPVAYPAEDAMVLDLQRKPLDQFLEFK